VVIFLSGARAFLFSGVSVLGLEPTDSPVGVDNGGQFPLVCSGQVESWPLNVI
jgi:hypothetical protein